MRRTAALDEPTKSWTPNLHRFWVWGLGLSNPSNPKPALNRQPMGFRNVTSTITITMTIMGFMLGYWRIKLNRKWKMNWKLGYTGGLYNQCRCPYSFVPLLSF